VATDLGTSFAHSWGADMESVREASWNVDSRFGGEVSLVESSMAAEASREQYAHAIKTWWKRRFELIREMPVVERRRQFDDVEQGAHAGVPRNFVEAYSPILQWLRGRD
jgi:hypothetical protein